MMAGNNNNQDNNTINNTAIDDEHSGTLPMGNIGLVTNPNDLAPNNMLELIKFYIGSLVQPATVNLKAQFTRYLKEVKEYKKCCDDYTHKYSNLEGKVFTLEKVAWGALATLIAGFASVIVGIVCFYYLVINNQITELKNELNLSQKEIIKLQTEVETYNKLFSKPTQTKK